MPRHVSDFAALALVITTKGARPPSLIRTCGRIPGPKSSREIAALSANHVQRFGLKPKIALVSHSEFGSYDTDSSR